MQKIRKIKALLKHLSWVFPPLTENHTAYLPGSGSYYRNKTLWELHFTWWWMKHLFILEPQYGEGKGVAILSISVSFSYTSCGNWSHYSSPLLSVEFTIYLWELVCEDIWTKTEMHEVEREVCVLDGLVGILFYP